MTIIDKGLRITIVTVVLNSRDLLVKTLESITNQTYPNTEFIVIDGGSTDGSLDIIKRYAEKIETLIVEPDRGIYDAMNKASDPATGDFLIFMNAGDSFFSHNSISEFVQKVLCKEAIYYGDAIYSDSTLDKYYWRGGSFTKYRLAKTNICHQTIFYPKKVYKSNFYTFQYKMFADWAYNIKLFRINSFVYLNQTIAYYDSTGLSASRRDIAFEKAQKLMILKYLGFDSILYLIFNKLRNLVLKKNKKDKI
jgi:glycosyltransferase involved in cell wall biosynthesis